MTEQQKKKRSKINIKFFTNLQSTQIKLSVTKEGVKKIKRKMEILQQRDIMNIFIAVLGFLYIYCANNNLLAEAKTKMTKPSVQEKFAKKSKTCNKNIIEPPPIPIRDWRISKRSMELDYNKTTKQGYKSLHKGKYKIITDVARYGRNKTKLDLEPFKVASTELILKIDIAGCVYAHNEIRRKHNLSDLLWDTDLSYGAEEWALVLAARGKGTSKFFTFIYIDMYGF